MGEVVVEVADGEWLEGGEPSGWGVRHCGGGQEVWCWMEDAEWLGKEALGKPEVRGDAVEFGRRRLIESVECINGVKWAGSADG